MRPMILVLSLVLGVVPLIGIVWIFLSGMITVSPFSATVDGLFMTLILLTLSACFLLNAFWEARDQGLLKFLQKKKDTVTPKPATATSTPAAKTPAAKATS